MKKKYLKKLTKAQLIRLLLKKEKIDKLKSQRIKLSRWLTSMKTLFNHQNNSEMHTSQFHHRELENGKT